MIRKSAECTVHQLVLSRAPGAGTHQMQIARGSSTMHARGKALASTFARHYMTSRNKELDIKEQRTLMLGMMTVPLRLRQGEGR
jgi:hypothetical protein